MNQILYSGKKKKNIEFNINNKTIAIIAIILFAILIFLFSTIFAYINKNNTNILSNVTVSNVVLSDLSKEEAISKLETELSASDIPDFLDITVDGITYKVDATELQITYDYTSTYEKAYNIGRNSNIIVNNYTILKTVLFGTNISPVCIIEQTSLDNLVKELESNLNIENIAIDQTYKIEDDILYVTQGTDGYSLDKEQLKLQLANAYATNDYTNISTSVIQKTAEKIDIDKLYASVHTEPIDAQKVNQNGEIIFVKGKEGITFDIENAKNMVANTSNNTIEIPIIKTEPSVTNEMIMEDMFNDILATYTTGFDKTNTNRAENIKLAVNKINGTILLPEDEFSFNNIVGDRTELAGFKLANVYSNGKIEEGIGGGVCQVSSTLYNVALLSNLQITERRNHTYQVSYVPLGQDATVSYGTIDLKFKNNRVTPVKIVAEVSEDIIKINILGTKSINDYDVKIENKTTQTTEFIVKETQVDTLNKGKTNITQKGMNGYTVETYKVLYKDAIENSRQLITTSTYMPLEQLVEVGTKQASTTNKKPNKNNNSSNKNNGSTNTGTTTPTTPTQPTVPDEPYTPPTLPPGWDVPENPYN